MKLTPGDGKIVLNAKRLSKSFTSPDGGELRVLAIDGQLDFPSVRDRDAEVDAVVHVAADAHVLIEEVRLVGEDRPAVAVAEEGRELEHVVASGVARARGPAVAPVRILGKK